MNIHVNNRVSTSRSNLQFVPGQDRTFSSCQVIRDWDHPCYRRRNRAISVTGRSKQNTWNGKKRYYLIKRKGFSRTPHSVVGGIAPTRNKETKRRYWAILSMFAREPTRCGLYYPTPTLSLTVRLISMKTIHITIPGN